jgi:hypothetical protein
LLSESTFPLSSAFLHHALLLDLAFKQSVQKCHLLRSFQVNCLWRQVDVIELFRRSYGLGITACASLEYALSIPLPSTAVVT